MDESKLRAWWWRRQGLDASLDGEPAASVLERTGWARSVGGAGPYLTLFARTGTARADVDAAVAKQEIHELPSARGCTYVVPARDFALALKVGEGFGDNADMRTARKLGATDAELDRLCVAIVDATSRSPLLPEELREAVAGSIRDLGDEGRKRGVASTLAIALSRLQSAGEIRRIPTDGRLDQQRYRYAAWRPNPLAKLTMSREEAHVELARRYFAWIAPATVEEFQWFSGLGVKASRAAVEPLGLASLAKGDARRIPAADLDALESFEPPKKPAPVLVSSLDGLFHLRRDVPGLLAPEDRNHSVFVEKGYEAVGGLSDLPSHAIVDRGRLIGFWEYDPEAGSIAWMVFGQADRSVVAAVERMERYVRSDLGDARSFSLDSPKSRAPRIAALRKAARG